MFTLKYQLELETIFIIIVASIICSFYIFKNNSKNNIHVQVPVPSYVSPITANTPTPTIATKLFAPLLPQTQLKFQTSSDGNNQLREKIQENLNNTTTYSFYLNNSQIPIFYKTTNSETLSIPFNTFSVSNTYFFLEDNVANTKHYLVFKTSGNSFTSGDYLDVSNLFSNYTANYTLNEITGWASDTLLIVNAWDNNKNLRSFWFDVTDSSFIPLATTF